MAKKIRTAWWKALSGGGGAQSPALGLGSPNMQDEERGKSPGGQGRAV